MGAGDWIQLVAFASTLIWGAATVKTELRHVRREITELRQSAAEAAKAIAATLSDHSERISRIEGRFEGRHGERL